MIVREGKGRIDRERFDVRSLGGIPRRAAVEVFTSQKRLPRGKGSGAEGRESRGACAACTAEEAEHAHAERVGDAIYPIGNLEELEVAHRAAGDIEYRRVESDRISAGATTLPTTRPAPWCVRVHWPRPDGPLLQQEHQRWRSA
jgi:hypothetical protein